MNSLILNHTWGYSRGVQQSSALTDRKLAICTLYIRAKGFRQPFLAWSRFDIENGDLISCLNETDIPALTKVLLHEHHSSQQVSLHAQNIPVRAPGPWLHWETDQEKSIT